MALAAQIISGEVAAAPSPLIIGKSFNPATVTDGGTTQMRILITNPNQAATTGLTFSDSFPAGMKNTSTQQILRNTCQGLINAPAAGSVLSLSSGKIASSDTCEVVARVIGTATANNITGLVSSADIPSSLSGASATLTVQKIALLSAPAATATFGASSIVVGGASQLTIAVSNGNAAPITGIQFTATYPNAFANVAQQSDVVQSNSCGGTVTAAANGSGLAMSGGQIASGRSCAVVINVTGKLVGNAAFSTGPIASANASEKTTGATATLAVTSGSLIAAPTPQLTFSPSTVLLANPQSTLSLSLANANASTDVKGLHFQATYDPGFTSFSLQSNSCGGAIAIDAIRRVLSMSGGTIAKASSCKIDLAVAGSGGSNIVATGSIYSANALFQPSVSTALSVAGPITATSTYTPGSIVAGGTASLEILLDSSTGVALTGISFFGGHDNGLINSPFNSIGFNSCGGELEAPPSGTEFSLSGASIYSQCRIVINVLAQSIGSHHSNTGVVSSSIGAQGPDASAALNVVAGSLLKAPIVTSTFSLAKGVLPGASSLLIVDLANPNSASIDGVSFQDATPVGLVAFGYSYNTCNGLSYTEPSPFGNSLLHLTGGVIPAHGVCRVVTAVTGSAPGEFLNHVNAVISANAESSADAVGALSISAGNLLAAPTGTLAFAPLNTPLGGTFQMTLAVSNPNAQAIQGAAWYIDLQNQQGVGLSLGQPAMKSNSCGGIVDAVAFGKFVLLHSATVPPGGCSLVMNVIPTTAEGNEINSSAIYSANALASSSIASGYSLATQPAPMPQIPSIQMSFTPSTVVAGGSSQLKLVLSNSNANAVVGASLAEVYPSGLRNANQGVAAGTCGGSVIADVGDSSLSLENGIVPALGSCEIVVNVTADVPGTYTNHSGVLTSVNAQQATSSSATLTVVAGLLTNAPSVTKVFAPAAVPVGGTTQMAITLANVGASAITNAAFVDEYPSGMASAAGSTSNTCGGTVNAPLAGSSLSLAGGTIPPHSSCSVTVNIVALAAGSLLNQVAPVQSANAPPSDSAIAVLDVTSGSLTTKPMIFKTFQPADVAIGGETQMTITVTNTSTVSMTGIQFVDAYPPGMLNSTVPHLTNSCGGTSIASANDASVRLINGTVAAGASCSVTVKVRGTSVGSWVNNTGAVVSLSAQAGSDATAVLTVNSVNPNDAPSVSCVLPTQVNLAGGTSADGTTNIVDIDMSLLFAPPPGGSLTYGAQDLPAGLGLVANILSGTLPVGAEVGGPFSVLLTATANGLTASQNVKFDVIGAANHIYRSGFDGASQPCQ